MALVIPEDNRFESDPDDALPDDPGLPEGWVAEAPDGSDPATVARLAELLPRPEVEVSLLVPFDRGDIIAMLHDRFDVVREAYEEAGTRIDAKVNEAALAQLAEFRVS